MDVREALLHGVLLVSAAAAMVWFWLTWSYSGTLWVYVRGVGVGFVIAVPDWVFFCRSPFRWLQPLGSEARPKLQRPRKKPAVVVVQATAPFSLSSLQCWPTARRQSMSGFLGL